MAKLTRPQLIAATVVPTLIVIITLAIILGLKYGSASGQPKCPIPAALARMGASPPYCCPPCSDGQVCTNGVCKAGSGGKPCTHSWNCDEGQECGTNQTCVPKSCPPPCPGQTTCVNGQCVTPSPPTPECSATVPCSGGQQCVDGRCVSPPTPQCSATVPCSGGQQCVDGRCVTPSVCTPACSGGQQCVAGRCITPPTPQCSATAPCSGGQQCVDGRCITPAVCTPACSGGQQCVSGQCIDPTQNVCSPECGQGEICIGRSCVAATCYRNNGHTATQAWLDENVSGLDSKGNHTVHTDPENSPQSTTCCVLNAKTFKFDCGMPLCPVGYELDGDDGTCVSISQPVGLNCVNWDRGICLDGLDGDTNSLKGGSEHIIPWSGISLNNKGTRTINGTIYNVPKLALYHGGVVGQAYDADKNLNCKLYQAYLDEIVDFVAYRQIDVVLLAWNNWQKNPPNGQYGFEYYCDPAFISKAFLDKLPSYTEAGLVAYMRPKDGNFTMNPKAPGGDPNATCDLTTPPGEGCLPNYSDDCAAFNCPDGPINPDGSKCLALPGCTQGCPNNASQMMEYIGKVNSASQTKKLTWLVFDGEDAGPYQTTTGFCQLNTAKQNYPGANLIMNIGYAKGIQAAGAESNINNIVMPETYWYMNELKPCSGNQAQLRDHPAVCAAKTSYRHFANKPEAFVNWLNYSTTCDTDSNGLKGLTHNVSTVTDKSFWPMVSIENLTRSDGSDSPGTGSAPSCLAYNYSGGSDTPKPQVCGTFDGLSFWSWDKFMDFITLFAHKNHLPQIGIYESQFLPPAWLRTGQFKYNCSPQPNAPDSACVNNAQDTMPACMADTSKCALTITETDSGWRRGIDPEPLSLTPASGCQDHSNPEPNKGNWCSCDKLWYKDDVSTCRSPNLNGSPLYCTCPHYCKDCVCGAPTADLMSGTCTSTGAKCPCPVSNCGSGSCEMSSDGQSYFCKGAATFPGAACVPPAAVSGYRPGLRADFSLFGDMNQRSSYGVRSTDKRSFYSRGYSNIMTGVLDTSFWVMYSNSGAFTYPRSVVNKAGLYSINASGRAVAQSVVDVSSKNGGQYNEGLTLNVPIQFKGKEESLVKIRILCQCNPSVCFSAALPFPFDSVFWRGSCLLFALPSHFSEKKWVYMWNYLCSLCCFDNLCIPLNKTYQSKKASLGSASLTAPMCFASLEQNIIKELAVWDSVCVNSKRKPVITKLDSQVYREDDVESGFDGDDDDRDFVENEDDYDDESYNIEDGEDTVYGEDVQIDEEQEDDSEEEDEDVCDVDEYE